MVAVGDIQAAAQVGDRREHFIGIDRMLAHDLPFLVIQGAGLMKDGIRYAHLANVVQDGAAADVSNLILRDPHLPG